MSDVCTINSDLLRLMDRPSIDTWCCAICNAPGRLDRHHIVKRSQGEWITDGVKHMKPTVTLCRPCHNKAHAGLLFFDWDDGWLYLEMTARQRNAEIDAHPEWGGKMGYQNARTIDGWRRLFNG